MPEKSLEDAALDYHRANPPGKLEVVATKPLETARDLALAYSPGVAAACMAIVEDPLQADTLTARGNLVAVISNGTAVLGLGDIGPLASKPVMEGKAVLFRKFAGINAIDIEVDAKDPDRFIDIVSSLDASFGGINLEDIKAPDCFAIEAALRERMSIPVFHDDQHGTAIIVAAAVRNWVDYANRDLSQIRLVTAGAGAAALACLDLLVELGLPVANIWVTDLHGVVHTEREDLTENDKRRRYAKDTQARTLNEVIDGADIFLGLSAPGVLKPEALKLMAAHPLVLAMANPTPEIMPDLAASVRPDAIVATGRSDFPNQVNNVLCFPFVFRGALDVGASDINEPMKLAASAAIAGLARQEVPEMVSRAYGGETLTFGPSYLIPKPFDPRLIVEIAPAVAKAAMETGVARRPIEDWDAYRQELTSFVYRSGQVMRPIFARAKTDPKRVVMSEGEEEKVLRAAQVAVDEGIARPILIGRRDVVQSRIARYALRLNLDQDVELVDPTDDPRYRDYWTDYLSLMGRRGVSPSIARDLVRTNPTVIGCLMVHRGDADAMICGTTGRYHEHLDHVRSIIGYAPGARHMAALNGLIMDRGTYFLTDTYVTPLPTAEELAKATLLSVQVMKRFGIEPRIALLSHSNFGSHPTDRAREMQRAVQLIKANGPDLMVDGEMGGRAAISAGHRETLLPDSVLKGEANLLVMPSLDAANIAFTLLRELGEGLAFGPILLGAAKPAHIVTPGSTVRGLVNMIALSSVDAQD